MYIICHPHYTRLRSSTMLLRHINPYTANTSFKEYITVNVDKNGERGIGLYRKVESDIKSFIFVSNDRYKLLQTIFPSQIEPIEKVPMINLFGKIINLVCCMIKEEVDCGSSTVFRFITAMHQTNMNTLNQEYEEYICSTDHVQNDMVNNITPVLLDLLFINKNSDYLFLHDLNGNIIWKLTLNAEYVSSEEIDDIRLECIHRSQTWYKLTSNFGDGVILLIHNDSHFPEWYHLFYNDVIKSKINASEIRQKSEIEPCESDVNVVRYESDSDVEEEPVNNLIKLDESDGKCCLNLNHQLTHGIISITNSYLDIRFLQNYLLDYNIYKSNKYIYVGRSVRYVLANRLYENDYIFLMYKDYYYHICQWTIPNRKYINKVFRPTMDCDKGNKAITLIPPLIYNETCVPHETPHSQLMSTLQQRVIGRYSETNIVLPLETMLHDITNNTTIDPTSRKIYQNMYVSSIERAYKGSEEGGTETEIRPNNIKYILLVDATYNTLDINTVYKGICSTVSIITNMWSSMCKYNTGRDVLNDPCSIRNANAMLILDHNDGACIECDVGYNINTIDRFVAKKHSTLYNRILIFYKKNEYCNLIDMISTKYYTILKCNTFNNDIQRMTYPIAHYNAPHDKHPFITTRVCPLFGPFSYLLKVLYNINFGHLINRIKASLSSDEIDCFTVINDMFGGDCGFYNRRFSNTNRDQCEAYGSCHSYQCISVKDVDMVIGYRKYTDSKSNFNDSQLLDICYRILCCRSNHDLHNGMYNACKYCNPDKSYSITPSLTQLMNKSNETNYMNKSKIHFKLELFKLLAIYI